MNNEIEKIKKNNNKKEWLDKKKMHKVENTMNGSRRNKKIM